MEIMEITDIMEIMEIMDPSPVSAAAARGGGGISRAEQHANSVREAVLAEPPSSPKHTRACGGGRISRDGAS